VAGRDRMTIEEVVRKVLAEEHGDVIREAVRAVAQELMEAEISELIGAERGERRSDDRATHRNGYRARRWDTRAGEIELQIPRIRRGSYFPGVSPAPQALRAGVCSRTDAIRALVIRPCSVWKAEQAGTAAVCSLLSC
jgi:transposase-like protein